MPDQEVRIKGSEHLKLSGTIKGTEILIRRIKISVPLNSAIKISVPLIRVTGRAELPLRPPL